MPVCENCSLIFNDSDYCPDCYYTCGRLIVDTDHGICEECGLPVCEDCQQPCKAPPNPMVDYPIHEDCYESGYDYDWSLPKTVRKSIINMGPTLRRGDVVKAESALDHRLDAIRYCLSGSLTQKDKVW